MAHRSGEKHPKATLTDHEVELMRTLHEHHKLGYKTLAKKFDVSVATVQHICRYRRRVAVGYA